MTVPTQHVRVRSPEAGVSLDLLLGETPPHYTNGFGGWELVARPRDIAMTVWRGGEPLAVEFSVMLDTLRYGERWGDVGSTIDTLIRLVA